MPQVESGVSVAGFRWGAGLTVVALSLAGCMGNGEGARQAPLELASCDGRFVRKDVTGPMVVGQGERCELVRVSHHGNLTVQAGGALVLEESQITGNITGSGATELMVRATDVTGSVWIGRSRRVQFDRNQISEGVTLLNNRELSITGNIIKGELRVEDNTPIPECGGNSVQGARTGQCPW